MLRGTCDRSRLLDLVEDFTLFSEHKAALAKIIGQNHQVLGVNAAIASLHRIRPALANPATLTPVPSPTERGESPNYRGGLQFSGLVDRARELRQKQTKAEDIVWELLRDRRFEGLKFRRQHQIGNYIADFRLFEDDKVLTMAGRKNRKWRLWHRPPAPSCRGGSSEQSPQCPAVLTITGTTIAAIKAACMAWIAAIKAACPTQSPLTSFSIRASASSVSPCRRSMAAGPRSSPERQWPPSAHRCPACPS